MLATAWQVARVLLQSAALVILAHTLGVTGYGALSGTVALFVLFAQFVGFGTGLTLARDISRDPALGPARWNTAFSVHIGSGLLLFATAWPFANWLLPGQLDSLVCGLFGLSELVIAPSVMPSAYWLLATDRVGLCSCLQTIPAAARFCAAAILLGLHKNTLMSYAAIYCEVMAASVAVSLYLLTPRRNSAFNGTWRIALNAAKGGFSYMLSSLAVTANSELDKTLLLRMTGPVQTGQYAAAFRVAQAATIPVNAFVMSFAPRLFRKSLGRNYFSLVGLYVATAATYGGLAAAILWAAAPYLYLILGPDFRASTAILQLLCFFVTAACFRQVVSAALTNSDHQRIRNFVEGGGTVLFVIFDLYAIPAFGWRGAATVAICIDLVVALTGLLCLYKVSAQAELGSAA